MKTINSTLKEQFQSGVLIKLAFVLICFQLNTGSSKAQLKASVMSNKIMQPRLVQEEEKKVRVDKGFRYGVALEMYHSYNTHGTMYALQFNLTRPKVSYGIAAVMQKRTAEVCGIKLNTTYLLGGSDNWRLNLKDGEIDNPENDILQLRLYSFVQYIHDAKMAYSPARVETLTNPESKINYSELRISTVEAAFCCELAINFRHVRIRNYAGFTLYYHPNYNTKMFHEKMGPALIFGTGINLHQ